MNIYVKPRTEFKLRELSKKSGRSMAGLVDEALAKLFDEMVLQIGVTEAVDEVFKGIKAGEPEKLGE